jgi:hypothetical protein
MPWDGDKNAYLNKMRDGQLAPRSGPYRPNPTHCCEACTFLRGLHADWCPRYQAPAPVTDDGSEYTAGSGVKA